VNQPSRPVRSHKPAAERQKEILAAAASVFAEEGYRSADVACIAEKAGVGKGTVYRQFANKEALFLATVEKAMDDLSAHVNDVVNTLEDPLEQIRTGVRRYFEFFDLNPGTVELFIQERAEFRSRSKPLYFVYQEYRRHLWEERFHKLAKDGRLRDISPELALDMIGNLVYGAVFTHRLAGDSRSLAEQSDAITDILFNGILTGENHHVAADK